MRIAVCDYAGHPFQIQLSRHLARRGHQVLHLYFADLVGPKGAVQRLPTDPATYAIEGLSAGMPVARTNLLRRRRQEAQAGALFAARCRTFAPDVILSSNMPLDALPELQAEARRGNARFVVWLQDVISLAMDRILGKRGWVFRLVAALYRWKERRLLRDSDAVVAISEDFRPILQGWGVADDRIEVIPNWAPIEELPVVRKENDWARRFGVAGRPLILYAGTLGFKHDPAKLVALSEAMAGRAPDVRILVASEGPGADHINGEVERRGLANLQVVPFQPMEELPQMLGAADVLVVLIERDAGIFSVPSKLLSCLCAARAVLLSVPGENLAARIVQDSQAGIVIDPDDQDGFVEAALRLIGDGAARARHAAAGRRYAETTFDIEAITRSFEAVLIPGRAPADQEIAA